MKEEKSKRKAVPAHVKRAVLVEAGHRCAIPTCRATTTEIAHIVPWHETNDDAFENLIALCPNCHTRYDQKRDIDLLAMKIYKSNLGIMNHRYGEVERRLFEALAISNEPVFVLGPEGDVMVANALKDNIFGKCKMNERGLELCCNFGNAEKIFPLTHTFYVTDDGRAFIERYVAGQDIAQGVEITSTMGNSKVD